MRGTFFLWLLIGLVALAVLYFLFLVGKSLVIIVHEMWTNRELTKLAEEYSERRNRRHVEAEQRVMNGCSHEFDDEAGALPEDVCRLCGIAKERPAGECDHIWRVQPGIIPRSNCELCGAEHVGVPT